jgi:PAS domain S-box-containing protein
MKTVLIVEDEKLHLEKVKEAFNGLESEYSIHSAQTLQEAYQSISRKKPDIILTDNRLPDGEGRDIVKKVANALPVIMMTAYGDEQLATSAMKEGALDYVVKKPENLAQMPKVIERSLREWKLIAEKKRLEKELINREKKYKSLFEESNDAIFIHNLEGEIVDLNKEAIQKFGYQKQELIGKHVNTLHNIDPKDEGKGNMKENLVKGYHRLECIMVTKTGKEIYADISSRIFDKEKGLVQGIVRDITEWKENERTLSEQKEKYQQLVENAVAGIGITDLHENLVFVNHTFAKMLGYTKKELTGKNLSSLTNKETFRLFLSETEHKKKNKKSIYEASLQKKDGNPLHILIHSSPYHNSNGETIGTIGVIIDITERKRIEKEIKRSEIFNREIMCNVGEGIIVYDKQLCYKFWNPFMEKITGKKAQEVMGKYAPDVFPHLREHGLIEQLNEALKGKQTKINDIPFTVPQTGKSGWVTALYSPHYDESGNIIGVIATVNDITEYKKAEQELAQLNKTKDRLFSIIAHDLRNPISEILGFSELLVNKSNSYNKEKTSQFHQYIYYSTREVYNLLENLMEWSRLQRGKRTFNPEEFLLYPVVTDALETFQTKADKNNVELVNKIPKRIYVHGDQKMIHTIIRNLVSNALKYTNTGGIIQLSTVIENDKVTLSVADNGKGMKKEQKQKLFTVAENKSTEGISGEKGSGMGLTLCKELVEQHNEKIWVESENGNGTTLYFTLKLVSNVQN